MWWTSITKAAFTNNVGTSISVKQFEPRSLLKALKPTCCEMYRPEIVSVLPFDSMRQPVSGDANSRYDLLTLEEDSQAIGHEPIYLFPRQLLVDLVFRRECGPFDGMHSDS